MTKITDLAFTTKDRKAGNWRVKIIEYDFTLEHEIWHHGTRMLTYITDNYYAPGRLLEASGRLGYGGVSDQGGMNQLMRRLHIPVYYSRKDGAHFESTRLPFPPTLDLSTPGAFYYENPEADHV